MKLQFGAVFAIAFVLTGCYESDKELFHLSEGEEVPLQKGIYTCAGLDKKRVHYDVDVAQVGSSFRYTLSEVTVGKKRGPPGTATFHAGVNNTYLLAIRQQRKSALKYAVGIVRWNNDSIEWVVVKDDAENKALAKQHGVTMGANWKMSGPVESQLRFLKAVISEKNLEVLMTCQRDLR
jgi:hypothetical protein